MEYLRAGRVNETGSFLEYAVAAQMIIEYSDTQEKRIFLDAMGEPLWFVLLAFNRNERTLSISERDAEGKLLEHGGIAQELWTLDERGLKISSVWFNKEGERFTDEDGICQTRRKYDNKGNLVEESSHDAHGKLVESNSSGFTVAVIRWEYDDRGNQIEESYYGSNGKLKEAKPIEAARIRRGYDGMGNKVEERFYGADGQLKESWGGIAIWRHDYDERGNRVEVRCYGKDEELKENRSDIAIIRWVYDQNGNCVETRFYGVDGKSKVSKSGHAIVRREYDERGTIVKTIYLDQNENMVREVTGNPHLPGK